MPQKTWVVGEEVLAPDFNTYVQNQVVPRFASVAARDAAWPAATALAGAFCVTTDTNTLWQVIGNAWALPKPWAMPWGRMAYTSGQGQLQTAGGVELVLMTTPPFNNPGNRWYKITADFTGFNTVTLDTIRFTFRQGTTVAGTLVKLGPGSQPTTAYTPFTIVAYSNAAAANAAQQFCVCAARTAGTGSFTFVSAGTYENSMAVEDMGPVAGP